MLAEDETHMNLLPYVRASSTLRTARPQIPIPGTNRKVTVLGALEVTTGVRQPRGGPAEPASLTRRPEPAPPGPDAGKPRRAPPWTLTNEDRAAIRAAVAALPPLTDEQADALCDVIIAACNGGSAKIPSEPLHASKEGPTRAPICQ